MADPVSLALGIAPICITAIKGLIFLSSKLKTFRNHCNEIKQFQRKLRIQGDTFRDHLHLLLRQVLDRQMADSMMNDPDNPQWQAKELEDKLRSYLGSKYVSFEETIGEIREIIEDLVEKFSAFTQSDEVTSLSKSTQDAIRITFKKRNYLESLQTLRESNEELRRIRGFVGDIHQCSVHQCSIRTDHLSLPSGYETIRNMSSSLYNLLLGGSLSCSTDTTTHHYAKLLLNSTDEITPNINFLFEHRPRMQSSGGRLHPNNTSQQQCGRIMLPMCASCQDDSHLLPQASSPKAGKTPQQRHVHDTNLVRDSKINTSITIRIGHAEGDGEDLTRTGVKCEELMIRSKACSGPPPRSLGYLNIRENRKLVLHPGLQGLRANFEVFILRQTTPLIDFLKFPAYDVITDVDRIKLGITLVKSMLKYNSTPWWPQDLTLRQVHVLTENNDDLSSSLDTLHISMELEAINSGEEDCHLNFLSVESIEEAQCDKGIRNLTLYSLGVALLQIGLWENIPWDDHEQVRKKTAHLSWLGKRYRDATKKLIDCDFGLATEELRDKKLQSAIFRDVIGDLESIIKSTS